MKRRVLIIAGTSAALLGLWLWARQRARAFEDRDVLLTPAPGKRTVVDGVTLHYIEEGDGPPLVLIHGLGASTYTWRRNIDGLSCRFRVIAVDLLGFGYSQRVADADYSLQGHARRVAQLLTQRGIGGAAVVGHSLGGLVALHLANEFPEKVDRLVLIDTATGFEMRALAGIRYLGWLRPFVHAFGYQNRWARRRALLALYADPASVSDDVIDHYLAMARFKGHQEALMRLARAVARGRAPDLGSIAVPVLVIWGTQDRLVPASRARWLLRGLPAARLVQVSGAGHMVPEERPEQFEAFVIDFATPEGHAS